MGGVSGLVAGLVDAASLVPLILELAGCLIIKLKIITSYKQSISAKLESLPVFRFVFLALF